jgi:hypothetical protein
MKILLPAAAIVLLMTSCNSNKSGKEADPVVTTDTTVIVQDTSKGSIKDTAAAEPGLGGIGDLALGMRDTKAIALLGEPESKSKAVEWGADGLMHQDWIYTSKGITLNMDNSKGGSTQSVFSITASSPCTWKTKMNMGIGSTYKEVMAAYEKEVDKTASDNKTITVGSVYGGIIFTFGKDDKADTIFIGAAAE